MALLLVLAAEADPAAGKVYLTQDEALLAAFPAPARVERRTLCLDDARAGRVEKESGDKLPSRLIPYYVGRGHEGVLGYAYFDTHLVRTLPETIMVLVKPDGTLGRITILSFAEPEDYFPREAWMDQFPGRRLDSDLAVRRGIRNLTGASLTAEAIGENIQRRARIFQTGSEFCLKDITVQTFSVPHDAAEPTGFVLGMKFLRRDMMALIPVSLAASSIPTSL